MPYKNPADRKRTKAAKAYDSRPDVMAKRRARNRARYKKMKEGAVTVGDGKDVDHIRGVEAGNGDSNLRVQSKSQNRSFERNSDHSVKRRKK